MIDRVIISNSDYVLPKLTDVTCRIHFVCSRPPASFHFCVAWAFPWLVIDSTGYTTTMNVDAHPRQSSS
jgi:hypothetical protein